MKRITFAGYELEIDYEKTISYYKNLPIIGEKGHCDCTYCRNYTMATTQFPINILKLLRDIGVNPIKDAEISHFFEANNKHMYVANYKVVGKLLMVPDKKVIDIYQENDKDYFRVSFEDAEADKTLDFYIDAFLPWLLEVKPD